MNTFSKEERLCSRSLIDCLYAKGHRMMAFPYSVQWMTVDNMDVPTQVMIVAPKRRLHHAVDRNRVKRLTRECWRLHKQPLYDWLEQNHLQIVLALVYVHNGILDYKQLDAKMDKLIVQLKNEIAQTAYEKT